MDNKNDKLIAAISEFKKVTEDNAIKIHGKSYFTVGTRLGVARRALGSSLDLKDTIIHHDDKRVIVQTEAYIDGKHVSTGMAEEIRTSSMINKTSALENCHSSSWGRALAGAGFSNDNIASAEEVSAAIVQQDRQLQEALTELSKCSHLGSYQAWVQKNKPLFLNLMANNPLAYNGFLEKFNAAKNKLEQVGVINGGK